MDEDAELMKKKPTNELFDGSSDSEDDFSFVGGADSS